ncbi:S8 family peptidase [Leptospira gomenensis]|uniref:S8 family peptidase n=1 Tax=Leptospira gomenensis TaxID=2484974 RepID=A0A5F1Y8J8_9LEPT|nr:S8 family peptidase [Leptospira gomenensis]TGK31020.1 S8 family peptidase [Leptospira gomenensis]TGK43226.1 S8 family peptidase [Leptospira gomenensis]TGK45260.1 S8 family peptidase [Leptospira gomenensis]TGK66174.1 S8 family peptidase [Leptospira gomenensis]
MTKIKVTCLAVFLSGILSCSDGKTPNDRTSFVSDILSTLRVEKPESLVRRFYSSNLENSKIIGLDLPDRIPGKYIVVFDETLPNNESFARSASIANEWKETYDIQVEHVFEHVLNGISIQANDEQIQTIAKDERVRYIEADQMLFPHEGENQTLISADPADWGLDSIDQRTFSTFNGQYHYRTNSSQVHAYIVDSGIRATLLQFGGRVSGGASFVSDGRGTDDCSGHGTGVASIVGANPLFTGAETVGTTLPKLHPVRIFPCEGGATSSNTIKAFDWIFANHVKPAVANLSFGKMGSGTSAKKSALTKMINAGITVVVSAGNDGLNGYGSSPYCSDYFPVNVPGVITVSSVDVDINRAPDANVGDCIHVFAPGEYVSAATMMDGTFLASGTSYATPFVSGVAAMFLAENPQATPAQTKKRIVDTATRFVVGGVPTLHHSNRFIYSLLDAPEGLVNFGTYMPLGINVINEQCRGANTVEWTRPLSGGTTFSYEVATSPYKDFHANVTVQGIYNSASTKVTAGVTVTIGQQKFVRVRARQQIAPYANWSHPIYSETAATYFNGCL